MSMASLSADGFAPLAAGCPSSSSPRAPRSPTVSRGSTPVPMTTLRSRSALASSSRAFARSRGAARANDPSCSPRAIYVSIPPSVGSSAARPKSSSVPRNSPSSSCSCVGLTRYSAARRSSTTSGTSRTTAPRTSSTSTSAICATRSTGPSIATTSRPFAAPGTASWHRPTMSRAIPIRLRLAALFATGTALVIGVGGAVFVTELSGALTNSLATGIESRAVLIATASRTRPVLSTGSRASNSFAQVLSSRGVVLDSSGLEARHALVAPTKLATITTRGILLPEPLGDGDDGLLYLESLPRGHDVLVVGTSLQPVDEALDNIEASLLIGGPVAVVLDAIASYMLAAEALRPVERLRRQAAAISEHDETTSRDIPRTDDEVAALARTLNDLLYRLQGALGRQRGFVSAAGHELRTPLANLKLELELAQRPGRSREELLAAIAGSADEVERLATVTGRLLLLAQSDERAPLVLRNHLDVVPVLTAAVDSCATIARERDVDLHLALRDPRLVADVDEVALSQ